MSDYTGLHYIIEKLPGTLMNIMLVGVLNPIINSIFSSHTDLFQNTLPFLMNSGFLKNNDFITKKTTNIFVINNTEMNEKCLLITALVYKMFFYYF